MYGAALWIVCASERPCKWLLPLTHTASYITPTHAVLLLHRPVEEAFDNGYMCITWEGRHGDDRAQGDYRMLWLGPPELLIDDTTHYPWKTNQKLPSEDLAQLHKCVLLVVFSG